MSLTEEFKAKINAFRAKHDMAEFTFGRQAVGDSKFLWSLARGRTPSLKIVDKVYGWMRDYKPAKRVKP